MERHNPVQAATCLLLRQRLYSLRFDITKLSFDRDIRFDTIQHYCSVTKASYRELVSNRDTRDGVTLVYARNGRPYYLILYNSDTDHTGRRRFTLAHELGHIHLNHATDGPREEADADAFASQLLMPRILGAQLLSLWKNALTPDDLANTFGVSRGAAVHGMRKLREPFRYTEEDYLLLERFGALLPNPSEPLISV